MPIQIDQRIPRCARCGKMVYIRAPRIQGAVTSVLFCSQVCQDEYAHLMRSDNERSKHGKRR